MPETPLRCIPTDETCSDHALLLGADEDTDGADIADEMIRSLSSLVDLPTTT